MTVLPARRLLLVHAHPDDESINNGATMAAYASAGVHVTLVTCTLGEEGEVIPADLAHLAADPASVDARDPRPASALGTHRAGELTAAMAALGVSDHRLLGGAGRYRDSGMMGMPHNRLPGAFWQADTDEAAAHLVEVVREVRPQVLVTYDPHGGYGHPDHIKAHRVAMRAAELAAERGFRRDLGDPHQIGKIYWNCVPRSVAELGLARAHKLADTPGGAPFAGTAALADLPGVVEDDEVTTVIDGSAHAAAKAAAMRAHATQVTVRGDFFALSNDLGQPLLTTEFYRLVQGRRGPGRAVADGDTAWPGREDDLFAGVAT
ncbi:N-acetyl-1-D-myo-inositol-2-amino-2-deoxy-alpha-D-glucopyranoside deacetylase [Streptomyces sp. AC536]|uniref:N-acetyl-1-D-myo-inositol-2-amino-2-deoxy-alpha- D-glucopyranoside deacetylase n=1 Tax=Streptomyces buecherae TaxID=2763006 RepID=UPI00164D3E96|nr:N-acetyl-1-D-myo-inositol-2-amino-2-deoxy-alpha-D-glucopyranoside deacetylase [Streptomyces buecherae]MBC3982486.1 N-acetyl-1-D-myo-inositol-2-amino-2-deoxy-alpha-D-glucopyranoside deacetylase [Streptomyces buecherae]QNJ40287.1 N-acetyl-1-D-myo-inositol-2-amino-2-deoxy-alpha-D-glucopyranoside deacetylase [Streptomyces buecherae]